MYLLSKIFYYLFLWCRQKENLAAHQQLIWPLPVFFTLCKASRLCCGMLSMEELECSQLHK